MHAFEFDHETDIDAVFICSKCGVCLDFNKSEDSDPHATPAGAVWTHPDAPDQWISPCTS